VLGDYEQYITKLFGYDKVGRPCAAGGRCCGLERRQQALVDLVHKVVAQGCCAGVLPGSGWASAMQASIAARKHTSTYPRP
jgi:hypothetical protein